MNRRAFIGTVSGGLLAAPLAAAAQQAGKLPRIGILLSTASGAINPNVAAFEDELRNRGWVEGRNIVIERRYAEVRSERYRDLAAELVRLKVDIIVALGGPASLKAARDATKTIPIVMVASSRDPIGDGLIRSFARPGGNITGLITAPADLGGKQLELLKEAVRVLSRVGVLWDATVAPYTVAKEVATAARSLGVDCLHSRYASPPISNVPLPTPRRRRLEGSPLGPLRCSGRIEARSLIC